MSYCFVCSKCHHTFCNQKSHQCIFIWNKMRIHVNLLWWIDLRAQALSKIHWQKGQTTVAGMEKLGVWPSTITSKRYWFYKWLEKALYSAEARDVWKSLFLYGCHSLVIVWKLLFEINFWISLLKLILTIYPFMKSFNYWNIRNVIYSYFLQKDMKAISRWT